MVTTRPMISLSGLSRKTSFDGPSLSSSGCSSFSCPKRGSQQQLSKCDCECGEANTLFRQQFLHQQQQQLLQHRQQHHQRNHHLVLLQLQAQKNKKVLKQQQQQQIQQQHHQQLQLLQKRPLYFPHPPPTFRPTISDSNSESDREGLEHFHRHLQQLHRITCASVENAIYFGGSSGSSGNEKPSKGKKSSKSFSFRDIRDIGKNNNNNNKKRTNNIPSQLPASPIASSSSSSSPLSPEPSSKQLKRRNTTRSAKDYIGVSRVKLLAKYWNKGRSSGSGGGGGAAVDSGNGSTSRSSDSGDSQLSNYSSTASSGVATTATPKSNGLASSNANRAISPRSGHKRYNGNQQAKSETTTSGGGGGGGPVTYKVRYDIPSSWESEQLLSFGSSAPGADQSHHHRDKAHNNKNKGGCATSASVAGEEVRSRKDVNSSSQHCSHCGRGPADAESHVHSPVASPKPNKTHLFKNLTFSRPQSLKPNCYTGVNKPEPRHVPKFDFPCQAAFSCENLVAATSPLGRTMVQQPKGAPTALTRSKSQKCPERVLSQCKSPNLKVAQILHCEASTKCCPVPKPVNHVLPISNIPQPKVRFKEQQHHRSEQCLVDRSPEKRNTDKTSLLRKWTTRRSSSSSTVTPSPITTTTTKPPATTTMLPDEREFHSLYDNCRIPRPKLRGIVPTHSYGVNSTPGSPVSGCSSAHGGENRRRRARDIMEFTEISLQDDDSETSGFESEQNNAATTIIKDGLAEGEPGSRKQQAQRNIPAEMTPAAPTPSRVLSFRKPHLPALLSRSGKKKGFEDSTSAEFLKSLPIFRKLNDGFFAKLSDHISEASFESGSYIFHQGERGDAMYFLIAGSAKATFKPLENGRSDEIFLKTIHPGDFFGERVFQTRNGQYTNNAIATSEDGVTCVKIDREAYEELIYKCHDFKLRVLDRPQRKMKLPDDIAKIKLEDLRVVTTLGVGGFGRVELCTLAQDCSHAYALKKMKKCQIVATRQIEHIRSEKSILLDTNCDFICKLYKTFKDTKYLYMLMEACLGGELWTVLRDRGRFEDDTAKFYIGCVIEALKYLHTRNIIYRDLKPENLLLDASGYVKLVDFGFAKKLDGRKTWTFCGTPEYCAPEIILNKGHDLSADFWSLGVLMYELLTGTPPFTGGDPLRTYKIILQGIDAIDFPPTVSKYAVNLIRKLCRDNPADRLGAQRGKISDIKKHKWFDGFDWYGLNARSLTPPIIPDVRGPLDFGNFDEYPPDRTGSPPDDISGWDWDF